LWGLSPAGTLVDMTAAGVPRRLGLEVQFDTEPIRGRLYDDSADGRLDRPFSGWLGLLAAIEAARAAHDDKQAGER
jgi:hypothetical protein